MRLGHQFSGQGRGDRGGVGGCGTPPIILSVKKLVKQASQLVSNC